MNDDNESCATCRFFLAGCNCPSDVDDYAGACRRNPPVIADRISDRRAAEADGTQPFAYLERDHVEAAKGVWPWVWNHGWCGEYQPKSTLPKSPQPAD